MSEGRYNIPKRYKVDKGMPLEALSQHIDNEKCKSIFETEIAGVTWCYQIIDDEEQEEALTPSMLIRHKGISVFEISMKHKVSPELMTEMFTSLIPKRCMLVYLCEGELAMAVYIPSENGYASRMCATDYYPFDTQKMIEVMNYEYDADKTVEQIHKRMLATIRQQKRIIMVEKAFESLKQRNTPEKTDLEYTFDEEDLNKIREDADFVQEQLHVHIS